MKNVDGKLCYSSGALFETNGTLEPLAPLPGGALASVAKSGKINITNTFTHEQREDIALYMIQAWLNWAAFSKRGK